MIDLPQVPFAEALESLFGEDPLPEDGVVQTAAVVRRPDDPALRVLRIDDQAPPSRWDALLLFAARAWCDVVVSSGSIWRAEPELDYGAPTGHEQAWWDYRRQRGRERPPEVVVLTSGRGFPLEHRALRGEQPVTLFGPPGLAELVGSSVAAQEDENADAVTLVDWWRRERGERTRILIELGPAAAGPLHVARRIDRLVLSVFFGSSGNAHAALLPPEASDAYRQRLEARRDDERSGCWLHRVLEGGNVP